MEKKKIAIFMTDLPFPVRKNGISIRYYPIIRRASEKYEIELFVISNSPVDLDAISEAEKLCSRVCIYERKTKKLHVFRKIIYGVKSLLPWSVPFSFLRYDHTDITSFLISKVAGKTYDLALCVQLDYAVQVMRHVSYRRITLDLIDSPYATKKRLPNRSALDRYDTQKVKYWERAAISSVDYACYVSPLDLKMGAGDHFPETEVGVIPNGLYTDDIVDDAIKVGDKVIGYLGHMGYPPNVKAALRLIRLFLVLVDEIPDLTLVIIGRDPSPLILDYQCVPGIFVTGSIENIWPHINGVDVFVFPMEIGSGQQNKILEAMGAGKAVVTSTLGGSGIRADNGKEIVEVNSDAEFLAEVKRLIYDDNERARLGAAAKDFVFRTYSWDAMYNLVEDKLLNL